MVNTFSNHPAALVETQLANLVARLLQKPLAILAPAVGVAALVGCSPAALYLAGPLLGVLRAVASFATPYQAVAPRVSA